MHQQSLANCADQIGRPVSTLKAVKARVPRVPICTKLEIADPGILLLASPVEYPRAYMMRPAEQTTQDKLIYTCLRKLQLRTCCDYKSV